MFGTLRLWIRTETGTTKYSTAIQGVNSASGMQMEMNSGNTYPALTFHGFALTRWGNETRPTHILVSTTEVQAGCCKPVFLVLDANGSVVAKRESPLGDLLNRMVATPVSFGKRPESEYFAVLQNNFARDRSMLLLYDRDGQIAYQEILAETCLGMNVLPGVDTGRLLVGCASKIW